MTQTFGEQYLNETVRIIGQIDAAQVEQCALGLAGCARRAVACSSWASVVRPATPPTP